LPAQRARGIGEEIDEKVELNQTEQFWLDHSTNGIEAKNRALAGVATPIKFTSWRRSILNFARRRAEQTGMSKAK